MAWTNPGALRPWYQGPDGQMLDQSTQDAWKARATQQMADRRNAYSAAQNTAQQWANEGWQNPYKGPESQWNAGYTPPQNTDPTIAGVQGNGIPMQPMTGGSTTPQTPQVMPGVSTAQGYTPPPAAPNSATAQNPFLNLGLNAFTNTQQPYNPGYLDQVGQSLWNQANQNWADNINPTLNTNAIMAGGYGGDRTNLAKGVAADRLNQSVFNAMAPQYQQDYNAWQNRALQGGTAAAGVGQNLEPLDLSRMLGLGNLYNQTAQTNSNINLGAGDLALREILGLGGLDISRRNVDNDTARVAASSAGVPTYTNPLAAGVGGGLGIAQLLNMIFNQG